MIGKNLLINKSFRSFTFSEKVSIEERIEFLIDIFRYFEPQYEVILIRRKRSARKIIRKIPL